MEQKSGENKNFSLTYPNAHGTNLLLKLLLLIHLIHLNVKNVSRCTHQNWTQFKYKIEKKKL